MKKTIFIIGIILVILIANVTAVHAATASAELKASNTSVKPGDTFKISLYATYEDGNAIMPTGDEKFIYYSYDKSKIELINKSTTLTDWSTLDKNDDGTDIEGIALQGDFSSQSVYEWTFKVKENAQIGDTQFSITPVLLMNNAEVDAKGEDVAKAGTKITVQPVTITILNNETTSNEDTNGNSEIDNKNESGTTGTTNGSTSGTTRTTNGSTSTATAGKTDSTTATSILPKTGFIAITGASLIAVIVFSVIMFKKLRKYDGIE